MARLVEGQRYLFRRNVHKLTVKRRILHTWICFLFNQKKAKSSRRKRWRTDDDSNWHKEMFPVFWYQKTEHRERIGELKKIVYDLSWQLEDMICHMNFNFLQFHDIQMHRHGCHDHKKINVFIQLNFTRFFLSLLSTCCICSKNFFLSSARSHLFFHFLLRSALYFMLRSRISPPERKETSEEKKHFLQTTCPLGISFLTSFSLWASSLEIRQFLLSIFVESFSLVVCMWNQFWTLREYDPEEVETRQQRRRLEIEK